jgi:hypothetical protein
VAGFYAVPQFGTGVWIEFEAGDPSRPVWSGCWWGAAQIPLSELGTIPTPFTKVFATDTQLHFSMDDATQTITITDKLPVGNKLQLNVVKGSSLSSPTLVAVEAPQIRLGLIGAQHAVHGEQLLAYLATLVAIFNTHVHPGELAIGILPVTPALPVAPFPPPPPTILSPIVSLD